MEDLFNKLLLEVLEEGKQVGKLYHFTSYLSMAKITSSDFKLKGGSFDLENLVSFTRNKNFKSYSVTTDQVRITLNGDKLSSKYKITPYADTSHNYGRYSKRQAGNEIEGDESEERINIKSHGGYINILPYLEVIEIIPYKKNQPQIKRGYEILPETMKIWDNQSEKFVRFVDKFN